MMYLKIIQWFGSKFMGLATVLAGAAALFALVYRKGQKEQRMEDEVHGLREYKETKEAIDAVETHTTADIEPALERLSKNGSLRD